ncbi:hypothetical protein B5F33_01995 [Collinsella sp. An2]|nr:hypothetical protein B5F33_01995 [Collinsella sp. An2]
MRAIRWARQRYRSLPWTSVGRIEIKRALESCVPNKARIDWAELERQGFFGHELGEELQVLVGNDLARRKREGIRCRVQSRELERGMLMRVLPGLYCASPALAAMQYARGKSFAEVFMLVTEFLGTYTLPAEATWDIEWGEVWPERLRRELREADHARPVRPVEQEHSVCMPATTIQELRRVSRLSRGSKDVTFQMVVNFAMPGAASPAEAIMAGQLGLPQRHGGFGCRLLPKGGMKLNHRIDFDTQATNMASGVPYAVCDAYIPAAKTDVEYSGVGREAENAHIHDEGRSNGLRGMGVRVIVINKGQMRDLGALEAMVRSIYRSAGRRFQRQTQEQGARQAKLLDGLRRSVGLPPA